MLRPIRRSARRAAGVALLLVLVVLLLVATLATEIALTARTHHDLALHAMNDYLLRSVVDGRREILRAALRYDATRGDNIDTEDDDWAWSNRSRLSNWGDGPGAAQEADTSDDDEEEGRKAYRNRDIEIEAYCEDERAKLNLRGLLWEEDRPEFLHTRATLVRLIDLYREDWTSLDVSDSDAESMVDDLVEWLRGELDSDEDPVAPTRHRKARLLSIDDLFRVPGGRWTPERLYDVRDPEQTEEGDFSRTTRGTEDEETDTGAPTDSQWERPNGVPGLLRYLTVWSEGTANTAPKINVNTAPQVVVAALLDPGQEDLAKAIVEHRRQGAGGDDEEEESSESSSDASTGFFKQKSDLTKVEGMGDDLARYPRLDALAEVKSTVFSLRVLASVVTAQREGDDDEEGPKDIEAWFQYREVVLRTQQGFVSLFAERRNDPVLGEPGE